MSQTPVSLALATSTTTMACPIEACGGIVAPLDIVPALRKTPQSPGSRPLATNVLKYADDQTVVALAAVLRVIHEHDLADRDFADWAIVAAPRFLGRASFAAAIDKFERLGGALVSPLIIPFHSLHVVSGTISLALRCRGPNIGVGGGAGGLDEALLTGLAFTQEQRVPGVWVVLSEWDPDPIADDKGRPTQPSLIRAVALTLVPGAKNSGLALSWLPGAGVFSGADRAGCPAPSLADLESFLAQRGRPGPPRRWVCPLSWGGSLALTEDAATVAPLPEGYRPPLVA